MTHELNKKIARLLKQHYPSDSPELKLLKLGQHATNIAKLIQDPLLWARLIYQGSNTDTFDSARSISKSVLPDKEEVVAKRLEILEKYILPFGDKPDLAKDSAGKNNYAKLFAKALKDERILENVYLQGAQQEQRERPEDKEGGDLEGIIVDLHPAASTGQWVGYVCPSRDRDSHDRASKLAQVYKFDSSSVAEVRVNCAVPLHIGDVVRFKTTSDKSEIAKATMKVVEYFPGALDQSSALQCIQAVNQTSPSKTLLKVLELPAFWRSMLNEQAIFHHFYSEILSLYKACMHECNEGSSDLSPDHKEFLNTFVGCAFIQEIPSLLQQDAKSPTGSSDFKAYKSNMQITIHLLTSFVHWIPNEAHNILSPLKCLPELPNEVMGSKETKSFALAVISSYQQVHASLSQSVQSSDQPRLDNQTPCISETVRDPLFWVRLLRNQSEIEKVRKLEPFCKVQLPDWLEVVEKRQVVLKTTKGKSDLQCQLREVANQSQHILQEVSIPWAASESPADQALISPPLEGVVADIYRPSGIQGWEGYIVSLPKSKRGPPALVYKFSSSAAASTKLGFPSPLHIGDIVSFKASSKVSFQAAEGTLEVQEYFPGTINEATARQYLSYVESSSMTTQVDTLLQVLQATAIWRGILNSPTVYREFYQEILTIYRKCSSGDAVAAPDSLQKLLTTFQRCSFVQNIPNLLAESSALDEQYQSNVHTTAQLLIHCVQYLPNEAGEIAAALGSFTKLLSRPNREMQQELKSFTHSLVTACLFPPPSVEADNMPWHTLPTILSKQEFQKSTTIQQPEQDLEKEEEQVRDLPKVKVHGKYDSIDKYGETYFKLLRADCYGELTNKVTRLKTLSGSTASDEQQDRFYYVKFTGLSKGSGHKIVYNFNFKTTLPKESSPSEESVLTHGNLVCFSVGGRFQNDHFWATVDHAEVASSELAESQVHKEHILYVELCSEANDLPDEEVMVQLMSSHNIVAVESPAYFRAYQPVLDALKTLDMEKIHFKDDLLDPSSEIKCKPVIVGDDSLLDPRPVFFTSEESPLIPTEMRVGDLKEVLETSSRDDDGPQLRLDESQRDAIKSALSQPLTVIQGPPGTGKTYIALKLLEMFLSLNTLPKGRPLIVMAYKNRALDHFMDECRKFCRLQDMVRIGHVSEGYEHLKEILLSKKFGRQSATSIDLTLLYRRVQNASRELERSGEITLKNCRHAITPQWLASLLLEDPEIAHQYLPETMKTKLRTEPQKCLGLLKDTTIKGWEDENKKQLLQTALKEAWAIWTQGLPELAQTSLSHRKQSTSSAFTDDDTEVDYVLMVEEHLMEADDIDDYLESSSSNSTRNEIPLRASLVDTIEGLDDSHVWELSLEKRRQLAVSALYGAYIESLEAMKDSLKKYNEAREYLELKKQARCLEFLKGARVVGVTTTGAAIHQHLLNQLEAPVVFVEEAAEILESNLLATLTPHVKHLILIGDHKQLKPQVACQKLARRPYCFNTSMFERLVQNNFPYTILMRQNRMNRCLVPLFSYHYAEQKKEAGNLWSNKKTDSYKHPLCMQTPFFWWSYSGPLEERCGTAITNGHEVKMVTALCLWLLSQRGCKEEYQITVLSPYRAQVNAIRASLETKANQLKSKQLPAEVLVELAQTTVNTVDEFQGHESDVIILSLVRSNTKRKIGFLGERNRLVVGTSRQKCGLYIIGNENFLKKSSPVLWTRFIDEIGKHFQDSQCIGTKIPTICSGKEVQCSSPEELETAIIDPAPQWQTTWHDSEAEADSPYSPTSPQQPTSAAATPLTPTPTQPLDGAIRRQQSSPAALASLSQRDQEDAFQKCCLKLVNTDAVNKWKFIGRHLGLKEPDLDKIEAKPDCAKNIGEALYQMLLRWKQATKAEDVTPQQLIEALKGVHLLNVVPVVENNPF